MTGGDVPILISSLERDSPLKGGEASLRETVPTGGSCFSTRPEYLLIFYQIMSSKYCVLAVIYNRRSKGFG